MYKKIFIAIDNSRHSNHCIDLGIALSKKFNSLLVGCHVYDASLHQRRFRDMEKGLPQQYQDEAVLQQQRDLHTSLINQGLKLISESYLDVFEKNAVRLPFRTKVFCWKARIILKLLRKCREIITTW